MMLQATQEEKDLLKRAATSNDKKEQEKIAQRLGEIYSEKMKELKQNGCPFVYD